MGCDVPSPPPPRLPLHTPVVPIDRAEGAGVAGGGGGLDMPAIGWGSFRLRGPAVFEGVRTAMEEGYTLLDSAASYRDEEALAQALAASPSLQVET